MHDRNADWTLYTGKSTKIARESDGLHDRFYVLKLLLNIITKSVKIPLASFKKGNVEHMINLWSFADIS